MNGLMPSTLPSLRLPLVLLAVVLPLLNLSCRKEPATVQITTPVAAKAPAAPPSAFESARDMIRRYRDMPTNARVLSPADQEEYRKISNLSAKEIAQLMDEFGLTAEPNDPFLAQALQMLAKKDPALCCDYIMKMPGNSASSYAPKMAVATDREAVKTWLKTASLPDDENRNKSMFNAYGILDEATSKDHAAAIQLIRDSTGDISPLQHLVYQDWAMSEPEKALVDARQNLPDVAKPSLEGLIVLVAGMKDPEEAFRLANLPDYQVDPKTYAKVFQTMLKDYSYEAMDSLPAASPARIQSVLESPGVMEQISRDKPEVLVNAISGVLFIDSNLPLYERAVNSLSGDHPELAAQVISSLPGGPAKDKLAAVAQGRK